MLTENRFNHARARQVKHLPCSIQLGAAYYGAAMPLHGSVVTMDLRKDDDAQKITVTMTLEEAKAFSASLIKAIENAQTLP